MLFNFFKHFSKLGNINRYSIRYISQSHINFSFYESDSRGGADFPSKLEIDWKELIKESWPAFIAECKLFAQEVKDHFQQDRKLYKHGDTEVIWRFNSEDSLKNWRTGSDKSYTEGLSDCNFIVNDKKKAVFYGTLDVTTPKDGKRLYTGYSGIKTGKKLKSFFRDDCYDFSQFTHLELRVKGDGRSYAVLLGIGMYFDVNWFTTYVYVLHTRGGPYWETIRIPFSKFFLTSKGRIQDRQCPVPLDRVNSVGITCAAVGGPYRLEIDYIGVHLDSTFKENFAYELYKIPKEIVSGA